MSKKLKFLFMSFHPNSNLTSFITLSKHLESRGHECFFMAHQDFKFNVKFARSNWHLFDFSMIEKYNPDKIVIFNGNAIQIKAQCKVLRKKYKVLFAECGWLPQKNNIYIDTDIHHLGDIAKRVSNKKDVVNQNKIDELKFHYRNKKRLSLDNKKKNIFVPLQLEHDTSILMGSDLFVENNAMIGYISRELSDCNIFVKEHPKKIVTNRPFFNNVTYTKHDTYEMMEACDAVVGINSTCLIEARVYHKPVYQFGRNVIQSVPSQETLKEFVADLSPVNSDHLLEELLESQFNVLRPTLKVIEFLES